MMTRADLLTMDNSTKAIIWVILVEECGADPEGFNDFMRVWPDCVEYRFVGDLGMGGKVWANTGRIYVSGYPEDTGYGHEDRAAMIRRANARLEVVTDHYLRSNT